VLHIGQELSMVLPLLVSLAFAPPAHAQAEGLSAPPASIVEEPETEEFVLPGHHIEERRSTGAFVTGICMFSATYVTSAALGALTLLEQPGAWSLFLPVFGPLMYAGLHEPGPCGGSFVCPEPLVPFFSVALGLLQAVGALFFAVGLPTREVVVRDDAGLAALEVALDVTSDGASASLTGAL
jgi:hypothetical protein